MIMTAVAVPTTGTAARPAATRAATVLNAGAVTIDPEASPPSADDVIAEFAAAGVGVTSIDAPSAGTGVTLTDWQIDNVARQASAGAGLTGLQLRSAFPVADDGVPIDAIVAAWLITGESATAASARSVMSIDVATISDPATAIYPWAVLALFVHELSAPSPTPGTEPAGLRGDDVRAAAAGPESGGGVCAALSGFYDAMTTAIVAALQDVPVLGTLAELAVQLFEQVLGVAVKLLLVPIQLAITALGVAAVVSHVVDPWVFFIDKEPLLVVDYGVAPNAGNSGSFVARIEGGAILEWPAAVQACADLADVQLPDLDPNGAAVTWTTAFGGHAAITSQDDTIGDDNGQFVATLEYVTAVEAPETAAGAQVSDAMHVSVVVVRPENQQLSTIVEQIVGNALSTLPAPVADLLASLAGSAIGSVAQFNDPSGNASITVRFHTPPPQVSTTPETPPPTPAPSCVGRLLNGQGTLAGTTLELRADGTWTLDFTGFPRQNVQGVVVTLAGQMIGTWSAGGSDNEFVIIVDFNSPFTGTGTYQGVTLTFTLQELLGLLIDLFGAPTSGGGPSVITCSNGNVTTPAGEIIFS